MAHASAAAFGGGLGWVGTVWRSLETLLESFHAAEGYVRKVGRNFRGLSEGVRALEVFHSHAEEAWSASELLQVGFFFFYDPL